VLIQTRPQIVGQTNVEMLRLNFTMQDVNVVEIHRKPQFLKGWLAKP
jgi:hypothetical protein